MVSTYTISLVRLSPKRGRMGLLVPFNRWVTLRVTGPQKQSWHPRLLAEVRVFLALSSARITTRTQAFFFWYKWVNSHVNGLSCLPLFQGRFAKIKASYNHQRLQATKDDKANTWVLINLEVSFNQSTVLPELNLIKKKILILIDCTQEAKCHSHLILFRHQRWTFPSAASNQITMFTWTRVHHKTFLWRSNGHSDCQLKEAFFQVRMCLDKSTCKQPLG